jgi:hypothetical protein
VTGQHLPYSGSPLRYPARSRRTPVTAAVLAPVGRRELPKTLPKNDHSSDRQPGRPATTAAMPPARATHPAHQWMPGPTERPRAAGRRTTWPRYRAGEDQNHASGGGTPGLWDGGKTKTLWGLPPPAAAVGPPPAEQTGRAASSRQTRAA